MKNKKSGNWFVFLLVTILVLAVLAGGCTKAAVTTNTAPAPAAATAATASSEPAPATTQKPLAPAPTQAPGSASIATSTSAASASAAETPQYGGVLRMIVTEAPSGSIGVPENMRGAGGRTTKGIVMEPLLNLTQAGEIQPCLAESYEWASDLKSITLHLRKGVKFHDGTPFNSAAVEWNMKKRIDAHAAGTADITSTEIVDDYTYKINIKEFNNVWIDNLCSVGQSNTTLMISPTAYDANGKEWADWNPIGTGPFKFKKYATDQYVELVRNDDYWGGKPYLDGIKTTIIPDAVTAQLSMEAGEGDYIFTTSQQKDVAEALGPKGFYEVSVLGLMWNLGLPGARANSPFAKLQVREAVEYALDKEKIVKGVYGKYATPMYQNCKPEQTVYDPAITGRRYDPEKAKALLKEAGYPDGFKTTLYCQQMIYAKDIDAIQAYLGMVGIDCKLEVITVGKWIDMETNGWEDGIMVCPAGAETYRAYLDRNWVEPTEPNWSHGLWWKTVLRPVGLQDKLDKFFKINDITAEKVAGKEIKDLLYSQAVMIPCWDLTGVTMASPKLHFPDLGYQWFSTGIANIDPSEIWLSK